MLREFFLKLMTFVGPNSMDMGLVIIEFNGICLSVPVIYLELGYRSHHQLKSGIPYFQDWNATKDKL